MFASVVCYLIYVCNMFNVNAISHHSFHHFCGLKIFKNGLLSFKALQKTIMIESEPLTSKMKLFHHFCGLKSLKQFYL